MNIDNKKIRIINSINDRKLCFAQMGKAYFLMQEDACCETIFSKKFDDYVVLVYPDKIKSEDEIQSEIDKAEGVVAKFSKEREDGQTMLRILADFINGRQSEPYELNDNIRAFSKNHEVNCILYHQTKDSKLKDSYFSAIKKYAIQKSYIEKVKAELEKACIDYFFVKGIRIAEHYPIPALRTMGDCDVYLKGEDIPAASKILKSLGFDEEYIEGPKEWHYHKDAIDFELQESLYFRRNNFNAVENDFFEKEWDFVKDNTLDADYHFVFLLSHLKKHLTTKGVGFRQFMDLVIELRDGNVDIQRVIELSQKAGLKDFLAVCLALCEKWFDVSLPFKAEISDEFYKDATFMILYNGVFGYEKIVDENKEFLDAIALDGKIKSILGSIFIPYNILVGAEGFTWLKGKRILLPLAWGMRLLQKIKNPDSRKRGINAAQKIVAAEKKDDNFNEWGI